MINSIEIEGLRRHRRTAVPFQRLTVFAGPNGVGKSTVLDAITGMLLTGEGFSTAQAWMSSRFDAYEQSMIRIIVEGYALRKKRGGKAFSDWENGHAEHFQPASSFRFQAEGIRESCPAHLGDQLDFSGANLAAVVLAATARRDGTLERMEEALSKIVPTLERLSTEVFLEDQETRVKLFVEFEHIGRIPASQISGGTLVAIALVVALYAQNMTVLLIDDVEQGLHMDAQRAVMEAIRAVMVVETQLQVVLTTHSPFIMEHAEPAEIVLFGLDDEGHAVTARPDQHPDAKRLLEVLSPAELWSSVGEDWIRNVSK